MSSARTRSRPLASARFADTSSKYSPAPIATSSASATGPESSPSSSFMIEVPVVSSPAMIARSIGAAPRQRGSSDG